jgi:hypothetical protein
MLALWCTEKSFKLLNRGTIDDLTALADPDVELRIPTIGAVYHGHEGVAEVLNFWRAHFEGLRFGMHSIETMASAETAENPRAASGTVTCFFVHGKLVSDITMFDGNVLPATRLSTILNAIRKIWFDEHDKIIKEEITLKPDSLRTVS